MQNHRYMQNHRSVFIRTFYFLVLLFSLSFHLLRAQELWRPWYITPRSGAQHIDLSGDWELSYKDSLSSGPGEPSTGKEAFRTTVPNSIQWSLYKAGKLPHPYYHLNSDLYKWTDEKVWYYKKTISIPATAEGNYIFLCFDGLDYFSKVWVNDSLAGIHEGMFGGPGVEIGRWLKYGGKNEITVELRAGNWGNKAGYKPRSSGKIIKPWVISGGSGGEMFFSLGMWQGARIEIVPKVHIERPWLVTKSIGTGSALLHLSAEVFAHTQSLELPPWKNDRMRHPTEQGFPFIPVKEKLDLRVEFYSGSQKVFSSEFPLTVYEGRSWVEKDLRFPNPKLWNPTGLGDPNLYQVKVSLLRNGTVADINEFQYGIRTIERTASAGPRTGDRFEDWQFIINGRKIFVKGMNFTPQDVLLETSEDRYRWTLTAAKKMGVQLIRVWGGGLLETNTFYKLCDELGIMVWQDFPIGNTDSTAYPQDVWEAQVVQNILRLRSHPSLAVWCGGNEFNPYTYGNSTSIGILERNLRTFDNSRLFVRATPDGGSIHTYPDMDPAWYDRSFNKEAWVSETGMHSIPEAAALEEVVDPKEFNGLGKMWEKDFAATHPEFTHHFTEYGPSRVPRMLSRASHIDDMNDPSLASISEATQVGAGEFYQVLSDKVQANYPVTTGLMPWVFKRHWPVIAIQMMDWFGHAGAPYYFLKRTYEPTHIMLDLPRLLWAAGEKMDLPVKIIRADLNGGAGYKAGITIYDDAFRQLYKEERPAGFVAGPSVNTLSLGSFTIPADYRDRFLFILAELHDSKGKLISRSYYYPRCLVKMEDKEFYDKYLREPIAWITLDKGPWLKPTVGRTATSLSLGPVSENRVSADETAIKVTVKNTGRIPAFMVELDIIGVKRSFYASDDFLWLAPGESKEISLNVLWREKQQDAHLSVSAWNAAPVQTLLK